MNTITLNDDQLLLIIDVIHRAQDAFEPYLYDETEIEGYAAVSMLQMHSKLRTLETLLKAGQREPIEWCSPTQSYQFESNLVWKILKKKEEEKC
tara:strand:- start:445 stop:726 length:282 start_codon:yes stop_codon:yes gene_type:complete